jgi:hypothetical protein
MKENEKEIIERAQKLIEGTSPYPWYSLGNIIYLKSDHSTRLVASTNTIKDADFITGARELLPVIIELLTQCQVERDNAIDDIEHEKDRVEIMHLRRYNELDEMNRMGRTIIELKDRIRELESGEKA